MFLQSLANRNLLNKDAMQKMGSVACWDIYPFQGKMGYRLAKPLNFMGKEHTYPDRYAL